MQTVVAEIDGDHLADGWNGVHTNEPRGTCAKKKMSGKKQKDRGRQLGHVARSEKYVTDPCGSQDNAKRAAPGARSRFLILL